MAHVTGGRPIPAGFSYSYSSGGVAPGQRSEKAVEAKITEAEATKVGLLLPCNLLLSALMALAAHPLTMQGLREGAAKGDVQQMQAGLNGGALLNAVGEVR